MVINGKAAAAALVKARAAMKATVTRDAKANYGSYATLAAVMEAITPALVENGLALVQEAELGDGCITVGATLIHESGETIEFTPLSLPLGNQRTPQAAGSAITYGRRYQLTALFGLAPDDDDGAEASKTPQTPQERTNGQQAVVSNSVRRRTALQRNATQPQVHVDDAPEVDPDGPGNLFETLAPTDAELEILGAWRDTADAFAWAVEIGACSNEFEARNSLKNLINDEFGGKFTKANAGAVYVAYYRKQLKKAQERQEAA